MENKHLPSYHHIKAVKDVKRKKIVQSNKVDAGEYTNKFTARIPAMSDTPSEEQHATRSRSVSFSTGKVEAAGRFRALPQNIFNFQRRID